MRSFQEVNTYKYLLFLLIKHKTFGGRVHRNMDKNQRHRPHQCHWTWIQEYYVFEKCPERPKCQLICKSIKKPLSAFYPG